MANRKKAIILSIVLVVIVAAFAVAYQLFIPKGFAGEKSITVNIFPEGENGDSSYGVVFQTREAYLGQALRDGKLIEGTESDYGFFITAVDGLAADDSKQQWWCITKGGAEVFTGVDDTPILDGDTFELTLKTGY
jgi:hypothetical protein